MEQLPAFYFVLLRLRFQLPHSFRGKIAKSDFNSAHRDQHSAVGFEQPHQPSSLRSFPGSWLLLQMCTSFGEGSEQGYSFLLSFSKNETCPAQHPHFSSLLRRADSQRALNSPIRGILRPALQPERTFQGIVLITTEACPMETESGFFVARRGASARKPPLQAGNGMGPAEPVPRGRGDGVIKTAF